MLAKITEGAGTPGVQGALATYVLTGTVLGLASDLFESTDDPKLSLGIGIILLFFLIGAEVEKADGQATSPDQYPRAYLDDSIDDVL